MEYSDGKLIEAMIDARMQRIENALSYIIEALKSKGIEPKSEHKVKE